MFLGKDPVFFIHIPKTGGNSILDIIRHTSRPIVGLNPVEDDIDALTRRLMRTDRAWVNGHYRLNHPLFKALPRPRKIVTVLRDPVARMISNYNFTARMQATPWHEEVASGKMSLVELTKKTVEMFGHQWSYFDRTGDGLQVVKTGTATPRASFKSFCKHVDLFDFTDNLDAFSRRLIALTGAPLSAPFHANATKNIPRATSRIPYRKALTDFERRELEHVLESDLWFVDMARREYKRRYLEKDVARPFGRISAFVASLLKGREKVV